MATIMIVDDSPVIRRVISTILKKMGHSILQAHNGKMALEQLTNTNVDLVISDVTMPQMDGIALLENVRSSSHFPQMPFVMLTANGQFEEQERAKSCGADGFLTKPTSSQQLTEVVNDLLQRQ